MVVAGGSERLVVDEGDGDAIKRLAVKGWWRRVGRSVTGCRFECVKRNYYNTFAVSGVSIHHQIDTVESLGA